jgi:hypothetical protein
MFTHAITGPDARDSLLTEVEFKWLMAGHGWWIDMARFHREPAYAADLLRLAMASESVALRDCVSVLQARAGSVKRRDAT